LLVVIAITDKDERPVPEADAQSVYARLVAAKSSADKLAVFGFAGDDNCEGPYGSADDARRLKDVVKLAGPRGGFWDLCGGRFDEGLDSALATIESACRSMPVP
jgi:hypothetical protein